MDECHLPYPVLPAPLSSEEIAAANSGLEQFFEHHGRRFANLPTAAAVRHDLSLVRTTSGRPVTDEPVSHDPLADLETWRNAGAQGLLDKHSHLDAQHAHAVLGDDPWTSMAGLDVAAIDDSSVPDEVKNRIHQPTSGYMKDQAAVYNALQHIVVVPVDFAAYPRNPAVDVPAIRSFFFGPIGTNTLGSYFAINSFFHYVLLEGWIADCVRLPAAPAADQLSGSDDLVRPALEGANVDWSRFVDNDGLITQDRATVVIIAPFGGTGATRFHDVRFNWRGRQLRYRGQICFFDCKAPNHPDSAIAPLAYNVSIAAHELGHTLFGLPDRYGSSPDHYGHDYVGAYDIMSNDWSMKLYNAHDRMKIGWVRPPVIHLGHNPRRVYKLRAAETSSNSMAVIYTDLAPDEYWIVENRSKEADIWGGDPGFPQSGLCVWWVNAVDDVVIMINQHHASDKPKDQLQPELPLDPLFTGAVPEAFLFPQSERGAVFMRKISRPGPVMSFEV